MEENTTSEINDIIKSTLKSENLQCKIKQIYYLINSGNETIKNVCINWKNVNEREVVNIPRIELMINDKRMRYYAKKLVYIIINREIPKNSDCIQNTCLNLLCVNPYHLVKRRKYRSNKKNKCIIKKIISDNYSESQIFSKYTSSIILFKSEKEIQDYKKLEKKNEIVI